MTPSLAVLQGTLELLVLATLRRHGPAHGFEVLRRIEETTDGDLLIEEGSLYPALHRMEERGWIGGRWGISEKGRRARYYELTRSGEEALAREERSWDRYVEAVRKLVASRA